MSAADFPDISLMSAPAAKTRSEPVITKQPTSGSRSSGVQRIDQFGHELGVEGVEDLGTVQAHPHDPADVFEFQSHDVCLSQESQIAPYAGMPLRSRPWTTCQVSFLLEMQMTASAPKSR